MYLKTYLLILFSLGVIQAKGNDFKNIFQTESVQTRINYDKEY